MTGVPALARGRSLGRRSQDCGYQPNDVNSEITVHADGGLVARRSPLVRRAGDEVIVFDPAPWLRPAVASWQTLCGVGKYCMLQPPLNAADP